MRFQNYFRIDTTQFEELLQLAGPKITRQHVICEPIEAEQQLSICLWFEILYKIKILSLSFYLLFYYYRYLASRDSMKSMSYHYLVSLTVVFKIIAETCQILWEVLSPLVVVQCNEAN